MADGVRTTQLYIENIVEPNPSRGPRVSQLYIENIVEPNPSRGPRVSQLYIENIVSLASIVPLNIGVHRLQIINS